MKLLHIDSSVLAEHSVSRQLTARIVTDARRVRDSFYVTMNGGKIEEKNVVSSNPPTVSDGTTT